MADLEALRLLTSQANSEAEESARALAVLKHEIERERARLRGLQAGGDGEGARVAAERIGQLTDQRKGLVNARVAAREGLRETVDQLLAGDLELEGGTPLVLLPVRVEARYSDDQTALRVRMYHDSVHTESLDEGLGDAERDAGKAYWTTVWSSGRTDEGWAALVGAVGSRRAPWVAEALRPSNLAARPEGDPVFPDTAPRGAQQAVARTLPDRFFVRIEQDGAATRTHRGRAIPDELPVGLGERDELSALKLADGDDTPLVDESLRWLVDYTEAERVGMALTVPLERPGEGIRRLTVFGVRAALEPTAGAARLERLIRSHRFADGAEFLRQGTPTNNTESVRSEWSKRTRPGAPVLSPAPAPGSNAAVASTVLGVDPGLLGVLPGADGQEQVHAQAFNTALWTTTWGDAIEHLTPAGRADGDKRLDSPSLDAVRDHWAQHVRGRGPVPALRLGRQPYGILPLVCTDATFRPLVGGFVEDRLVPFVDQQLRWVWEDGTAEVPTVMSLPLDTALPLILGTDAVLRGLRVRTALSPDPVLTTALGLTLPDIGTGRGRQQVKQSLLLLTGVSAEALDTDGHLLGKKTRTLALPLAHETDPEFIASLLDDDPADRPAESVLQVLLAHAAAIERHARDRMAPSRYSPELRIAITENRIEVDRELLVRAMTSVVEGAGVDDPLVAEAAVHVADRVGRLDQRVLADRNPIPAMAAETLIQQIAGREPQVALLQDQLGMQLVGEVFETFRQAASFRKSLDTIARIATVAERELLLKETLDCCSHRLDAWITATASRRVADLRRHGAVGCFLGAYGWLENIEPRPPLPVGQVDGLDVVADPQDGGFVHAPGLTHAATAGVLRSGRLTHRRGDPNHEALEIDLSSTRVRDAISLLEGMRHQSLGALLGYRLERRLHERSGGALELDRFIYVLRTLAPLRAGKLTDPSEPAQESVAASDVVDGLRLLELSDEVIRAKLVSGPDDQRYLVPPNRWVPPRPGEAEAVSAAIAELEQTHDAVADLLLAESVHQLVAGNTPRAAAVLDLLGAGEAVPQPPDVVRTPGSGITIQHRVAVLVAEPGPTPAPGWAAAAPRALAEPRLELWAARALGDPATIPVATGHPATLDGFGLCALDVLYDSDGDNASASTLTRRIRAQLPALGEDLSALAPLWELAGILRGLLVAGRPFDVSDAGRPVAETETGRTWDAAEIVDRAGAAVAGLTDAVADADADVDRLLQYGVRPPSDPSPGSGVQEQRASREALVRSARARLETAEGLLAKATAAAGKAAAELAAQSIAAVFGAGFVAVPVLSAAPAGESDLWAGGAGPSGVRARPGADVRPWLARAGLFHDQTAAFGEALLIREARGQRPRLDVVQTPVGGHPTWVGLAFPAGRPPTQPMVSTVVEAVGEELGGAVAGVVLDEWTEVVPRRLERDDPRTPEVEAELVDVTTTGLAVNANGPGARPPQSILVGLSADGADWTSDRLASLLDEARALARLRLVTLQDLPFAGAYLPALYFRDWSLQGEPTIDWERVRQRFDPELALTHLSVEQ